jgi:Do/DeqQ family serine protease
MKRGALSLVLCLGLWFISAGAFADIQGVPQSRDQITLSFAPLVRQVAPAVVNIYTKRTLPARGAGLLADPLFQQFFGNRLPPGLMRDRVQNALGSGVLVGAAGLVVTSHHVIDGADEITVALQDQREFPATVVLADPRTDLAVLKMANVTEKLPFLKIRDSDTVEVGDLVLAIGNPFGVGQTVTSGIVSGLARTAVGVSDYNFFIQTDAAINPGNSGGALVTMDGQLVGINTAIFSKSGGSVGIGFAVPANMVRVVVAAAEKGRQQVERPWFGVSVENVSPEIAASLGLPRPSGAIVTKLHTRSPALKAGLKTGDVILSAAGYSVTDPEALRFRLATLAIGEKVALAVQRGADSLTIFVPLIAAPEDPPRQTTKLQGAHPLAGVTIENISPAVADALSLTQEDGVVITAIAPRSPALSFDLQPGDTLVRINGQGIGQVGDVQKALGRTNKGWAITYRRGGQVVEAQIR